MDLQDLTDKFAAEIIAFETFRGETTITAVPGAVLGICRFLKEQEGLGFDFLSDLCGLDRAPAVPRFAVVYHLYSMTQGYRLRLKCPVDEHDPRIDSVTALWPGADWLERECFDLYGICFRNHPDMRRILLQETFEGHPLRKEYPLEGL